MTPPKRIRQCRQDTDLDCVDRNADLEVLADEVHLWLVTFQSVISAAHTVVYLPRLVGLVKQSDGRAAGSAPTQRAVGDAAGLVAGNWTAAIGAEGIRTSKSALVGVILDSIIPES